MTIIGAALCPYCEGTFSKHAKDCPAMFAWRIAEAIDEKPVREVYKMLAEWRDDAIAKAMAHSKREERGPQHGDTK